MAEIVYRRATMWDEINIAKLAKHAIDEQRESGVPYPEVNEVMLVNWIHNTLLNSFVIVADLSGRIVGSIAMQPYKFPWSDEQLVTDAWLYVLPKFRQRGTADKLIELVHELVDNGSDGGPVPVLMAVFDTNKSEALDRFVRKHGYAYGGGTFMRKPGG